jgi:hypothetical protein
MPRGRQSQGPKLRLLQQKGWNQGIWYICWRERSRSRKCSTGTGDRGQAEEAFARWLLERGRTIEEPARVGPRYPHEIRIADCLAIYGEKHVPQTADPVTVGGTSRGSLNGGAIGS